MTTYVDRTRQQIGPWTVVADAGRTNAGKVLWLLRRDNGEERTLRTEALIKLARTYHSPRPQVDRFVIYRGDRLTITERIQ